MPHSTTVQIPETLSSDLVGELADLVEADETTARSMMRDLDFGAHAVLIAHGILEDPAETDALVLTEYGQQVIEACAAATYDTPRDGTGF